jgi:hypothetical protein
MSADVKTVFVNSPGDYKRDINPVSHYIKDSAEYLHIMTGRPLDECKEFVKRQVKEKMNDPRVTYLQRGENGDRSLQETTFLGYLSSSVKAKELIAATFTTYANPKRILSPYVSFIDENIRMRGVHKKAMFAAENAGDTYTYALEKGNQTNKKISNNSLSGGQQTPSTPLFNKTAHPTLTSTCRITSGYGNANNERLLAGNRHYHKPDIALNNIVSIVNNTDYDQLSAVVKKYNIVCPTADDVMKMVVKCSRNYWRSEPALDHIRELLTKMSPLQRAAVLYTGDLFNLYHLNKELVSVFIRQLAATVEVYGEKISPAEMLKSVPEDFATLAKSICKDVTQDLKKIDDILDTDKIIKVVGTLVNIRDCVLDYADLIRCFFVTANIPPSVGYLPEIVRDVAVTSDTDSTIFTVMWWVNELCGRVSVDLETVSISTALIFLAAQTITNVLAVMSANFGIEEKRIHQIGMKNEFFFDVFIPTQMTKHYYSQFSIREGNVYSKPKTEIKGVHMRSSNVPEHINAAAKEMMEDIMFTINRGDKLCMSDMIQRVMEIEETVYQALLAGDRRFYKSGGVKLPASYAKGDVGSPYINYTLWRDVFEPKYGHCPPPPFEGIRIGLITDKPALMKKYLSEIEDKALAARFRSWLERNGKNNLGTVILSDDVISVCGGIPIEIMQAADTRKMVHDICGIFYHILETVGYYAPRRGDNLPVFVSEQYQKKGQNYAALSADHLR